MYHKTRGKSDKNVQSSSSNHLGKRDEIFSFSRDGEDLEPRGVVGRYVACFR